MTSPDLAARAARVGRLAWIVFGFSLVFLVVLAVTHAIGSPVPWTVWALALLNTVNTTSGLPGLPIRVSHALSLLSLGLLLAALVAMVTGVLL